MLASETDDLPGTRLQAALEALDSAMAELDTLQRKVDQTSSRMEALLQTATRSPRANVGANLRSLDARSAVQHKALDRARKAYASARKTYFQASQAHREHHERDLALTRAIRSDLADARRSQAALERTVSELLKRRADETGSRPAARPGQRLEGQEGSYQYIPIDISEFFSRLIALERHLAVDPDYDHPTLRHRPVSFLDVGCGTGRNLMLVQSGDVLQLASVHGFDIDAEQIAFGRDMFGYTDELHEADALTFDYGAYDVVFSFRPFYDPDRLAAYEHQLVSTMRPSAYLIAIWPQDLAGDPRLDAISPVHGIWKKSGS